MRVRSTPDWQCPSLGGTEMAVRRHQPKPQVKLLVGRCAGLCAICREFCEGPWSEPGSPRLYGKIAHIYDHADEGLRPNPELTQAQRDCYENWIWVCSSHHDEIDDPALLHEYPADLLFQKKREIEAFVKDTLLWNLKSVGFPELEAVCSVLALPGEARTGSEGFGLLDPEAKIRRNDLGPATREQITWGLGKSAEVKGILDFLDLQRDGVAQRIAANFKAEYYSLWSEGLTGDQLFDSMRGFALGAHPNEGMRAAGLAVLVYLFEHCEVFES